MKNGLLLTASALFALAALTTDVGAQCKYFPPAATDAAPGGSSPAPPAPPSPAPPSSTPSSPSSPAPSAPAPSRPGSGGHGGDRTPESGSPSGSTGGGNPRAPRTGGGRGGAPAAPGSSAGPRSSSPTPNLSDLQGDLTHWKYWWYYNSRQYINVKQAIHEGGVVTGSDAFWLGRGQQADRTDSLRVDAGITRGEILPTLLALLETQRNKDLLAGCLIAVAKIGEDTRIRGSDKVRSTIMPFVGHGNRQVSEAAILALGILGSDEVAPSLAQLLTDSAEGRALCRQDSVNERARAFAAYSLGLIGQRTQREDVRRFVVNRLCAMFDQGRRATHDIQVACLLGVGLVPLASDSSWIASKGQLILAGQCHEAQVAWVLRLLSDRSQSFLVRAHVPTTLARLTQGLPGDSVLKADVVRAIMEQVGPGARAEREVEQSCVLALGQLADADDDSLDREVRERLMEIGKQVADQQARGFALISLGQIGGRPGTGAGDALAGSSEIRGHLAKQLTGGKNFLQPWAALGIGVMERALSEQGFMTSDAMVSSVRSSLKSARSPTLVGALCISLGLMRDVDGVQTLLATLDRHRHVETRAFAMLALGMVGARESIAPIQSVLEDSKFQPFLVHNASRGLALMRDLKLVPNLIDMLENSSSHASRVSVAFALGSVGDRRAVGALSSLALDTARPELSRGMAAEALGEVAHKDDLPWNTSLSVNANYRAATMTLSDPYATAVLDLY